VLFRDVMEHLESPATALAIVRRSLAPGGAVLVVFPPYYSPYGGHQQILPRKKFLFVPYNKLPYLQWLPKPVFLRIVGGDAPSNREVARLNGIRLTIRKFEREARSAGYDARRRTLYLSRPSFSLRYGLPVVEAGILGRIPLLAEAAVTAAHYLLSPEKKTAPESP
jgi:SAM-dependent methyltransferase